MAISVTGVAFAHPGDTDLFSNVSFAVSSGEHAVLLGENGAGKSTLMRVLAGELCADEGEVQLTGKVLFLSQDMGFASEQTVRELLLRFSPPHMREAGARLMVLERRAESGDSSAGTELGLAMGEWSELGGYELEGKWDASVRRVLGTSVGDVGARKARELSGGELKRLAIDLLFASTAGILLLDEPDNYLDIPAKLWLEDLVRSSRKTIVSISHDREYLANTSDKVITLEGHHSWTHGESYRTYAAARASRQASMEDLLKRWHEEERRLFQSMKVMKQRAAMNAKNAPRAKAAETRWRRFAEPGPPPPPAVIRAPAIRLRGSESARRALTVTDLALDGLILPFSDVVRYGERVALIGPNGVGKSHILKLVGQTMEPSSGSIALGNRVSVGTFTQINDCPEFIGETVVSIVEQRVGSHERAMGLLGRYGLERVARQRYETLSGGQRARLVVLALEVDGHNLLLLDEPTDNLDIGSSAALESALEQLDGTCIAVSHDRAFLRNYDRYWMLGHDGTVHNIVGYDDALASLSCGRAVGNARSLTNAPAAQRSVPQPRSKPCPERQ
jgi:ATPase subunit of ABC transporter with duplicated ATPase domains